MIHSVAIVSSGIEQMSSEVEGILDVMSDLLLFAEAFLEVFYLLAEQVVHLELLLHHVLQLLDIRVHVKVDVSHTLYF